MLMHMPMCLKKLVPHRPVQASVCVHMQACCSLAGASLSVCTHAGWQSHVACPGHSAAAQSTWMSAVDQLASGLKAAFTCGLKLCNCI